jgi:hypothetical protein
MVDQDVAHAVEHGVVEELVGEDVQVVALQVDVLRPTDPVRIGVVDELEQRPERLGRRGVDGLPQLVEREGRGQTVSGSGCPTPCRTAAGRSRPCAHRLGAAVDRPQHPVRACIVVDAADDSCPGYPFAGTGVFVGSGISHCRGWS